jgi:hypothetical protein
VTSCIIRETPSEPHDERREGGGDDHAHHGDCPEVVDGPRWQTRDRLPLELRARDASEDG